MKRFFMLFFIILGCGSDGGDGDRPPSPFGYSMCIGNQCFQGKCEDDSYALLQEVLDCFEIGFIPVATLEVEFDYRGEFSHFEITLREEVIAEFAFPDEEGTGEILEAWLFLFEDVKVDEVAFRLHSEEWATIRLRKITFYPAEDG